MADSTEERSELPTAPTENAPESRNPEPEPTPATEPEPVAIVTDLAPAAEAAQPVRKTAAAHAKELGTADWAVARAEAFFGWPQGKELTESEFQYAIDASDVVLR